MPAGHDLDPLEPDGDTRGLGSRLARVRSPRIGPGGGSRLGVLVLLLRRTQRLQEALGGVAQAGVSENGVRYLPAGDRELQDPVDEQQQVPADPGTLDVSQDGPAGDGQTDQGLDPIRGDRGMHQPPPGAEPFGQQSLVLPAYRPLRGVGPHRGYAEQGVEIEGMECPRVTAQAQVQPRHQGLGGQRNRQGAGGQHQCQAQAVGGEYGDGCNGDDQVPARPHQGDSEPRQAVHRMDVVTALGHVGDGPALEVALPQARQFAQQGEPQTGVQVAAQALGLADHRELDDPQQDHEEDQGRHGQQALIRQGQVAGHVEEAAEQERFHRHRAHREGQGGGQGQGGEESVRPQHPP
jgi:hypothetical protein